MHIYSNSQKNAFSFLDRFRFRLFYLVELSWLHKTSTQNFEIVYNSLIIIIYVNLFISQKMLLLPHFSTDLHSDCFLIGLGAGFKTSTQNFEIH